MLAGKKIILCSNTSWNIYNFRLNLARALRQKGIEVVIAAPSDEFSERIREEFPFISLKHLKRKSRFLLSDILFFCELYNIYKRERPDLVLHFTIKPNIYGSFACGVLKIPAIANVTGLGYAFTQKRIISLAAKGLYRFSLKFSQKVVFQNPVDLEYFTRERIIVSHKGAVIYGSGVNTQKFSSQACPQAEEKKLIFLMICRLLRDKGIKEFISAAEKYKAEGLEAEFWLAGPYDKENPSAVSRELINKYRKRGTINYLGYREDTRPLICQSSVVVLPSYREGMPKALLEAMAMEKPIITTNSAGCREVIKDGLNGFMVKAKDTGSLLEAIKKMAKLSPAERLKMGEEGRKMVLRRFDERIIVAQYLNLIEK